MELLQTLLKIRACEGNAAAQLLLEAYVMQEVAAEREACAKVCDEQAEKDRKHQDAGNQSDDYRTGYIDGSGDCGHVIRERSNACDNRTPRSGD